MVTCPLHKLLMLYDFTFEVVRTFGHSLVGFLEKQDVLHVNARMWE